MDKDWVVRGTLHARVLCADKGFIVREKRRASPRQHDDFHAY